MNAFELQEANSKENAMAEKRGHFDATRRARGITWRQIALEAGITASTLTRMAQGKRPDVDSLAALTAWSGLKADNFVRSEDGEAVVAEPLAMISTYLRSDPNLTS